MKFKHVRIAVPAGLAAVLALTGCSGPTEDVRITFCKNLLANMQPAGTDLQWADSEVAIQRPSHAITQVQRAEETAGQSGPVKAACWYVFEYREHLPSALANPIEEYATLPYAMTVDGRELSDAELMQAINAEQKRRGKALIDALQKGATDVAERVRAGFGG